MTQDTELPTQEKDGTVKHLTRLFSRCAAECPDATFQLDRSEIDGPGWISRQFLTSPEGLANGAQWAMDWNSAGWNIYVGENPRKAGLNPNKSATDEDVMCSFFSFADLDTQESIDIAKEGMPVKNTATTNTGTIPSRRVHLHWEHENPIYNMAAWKQTQIGLANYFKGDKVIDPRRILRLAGCISYPTKKKVAKGYVAELVTFHTEFDGEERDLVDTVHMHNEYAGSPAASVTPGREGSTGRLGLPTSSPGVELQKTLEAIQEGTWHNAVRDQVASWVALGWPADAIRLSCFAFTQPGYTNEDTAVEVNTMIRGAVDKGYAPDIEHEVKLESETQAPPAPLTFKPMSESPPEKDIPLRHFIYGRHLIAGFVAATISPGGVGKTTLMMIEAIAIAAGIPLLGIPVHDKGLNVLHINLEDPLNELHRRYWAILRFFNIKHEDIGGKVFLHSGRDRKIILADLNESGQVIPTPDVKYLQDEITRLDIQVVQIDPMVKAHYVDENNNKHIDELMTIAGGIAHDTNSAIDFAQHVRKAPTGVTPVAGDINQARGASSLAGAVRTARTLTQMNAKEAEQFGVPLDKASWFVRVDDAKNSMSPPAKSATWVERKSQGILNNTMGEGDSVGVLTPWEPPQPLDGISTDTIKNVLKVIGEGTDDDRKYTASNRGNSTRWVGDVIKEVIEEAHHTVETTPQQIKQIVKDWLKSGLLIEVKYPNPKSYKDEKGLEIDWSKQPSEVNYVQ